jgi:hypothetical protein
MKQTETPSRPDPVRWLWYTFGGGLGPHYRGWVLHDLTSRTHRVRQAARTVVQTATVGALAMLVLGFGWITWVSLIGGFLLALMCHVTFFDAFAEHRLFQHGYPWSTAQRIMNERDRRGTQIGYAVTSRSIATMPVDEPPNGLAIIPERSNTSTIGIRQRRLRHRSLRIGKRCGTGHAGYSAPQPPSR